MPIRFQPNVLTRCFSCSTHTFYRKTELKHSFGRGYELFIASIFQDHILLIIICNRHEKIGTKVSLDNRKVRIIDVGIIKVQLYLAHNNTQVIQHLM